MNNFLKELKIKPELLAAYRLPRHVECKELIFYGYNPYGKIIFINLATFKAWHVLQEAAQSDGIQIEIFCGFRSYKQQTKIIKDKLATGLNITEILTVSALPGYSEHHTGFALDLYQPSAPDLDEKFSQSAAFQWLCDNAQDFGFKMSYPQNNLFGIIFEPWHWCFQP